MPDPPPPAHFGSAPPPEIAPEADLANLDDAFDLAYYTPLQQHRSGADTKAGALLTGCGLMFSILAPFSANLGEILAMGGSLRALLLVVVAAFVAFSLGAALQAFRTISPRFPVARPSLAFFGDIARLSAREYVDRMESLSLEAALEEMLAYNHRLSLICVDKFLHLGRGVRLFRGAAACWLILMALVAFRGLLR